MCVCVCKGSGIVLPLGWSTHLDQSELPGQTLECPLFRTPPGKSHSLEHSHHGNHQPLCVCVCVGVWSCPLVKHVSLESWGSLRPFMWVTLRKFLCYSHTLWTSAHTHTLSLTHTHTHTHTNILLAGQWLTRQTLWMRWQACYVAVVTLEPGRRSLFTRRSALKRSLSAGLWAALLLYHELRQSEAESFRGWISPHSPSCLPF